MKICRLKTWRHWKWSLPSWCWYTSGKRFYVQVCCPVMEPNFLIKKTSDVLNILCYRMFNYHPRNKVIFLYVPVCSHWEVGISGTRSLQTGWVWLGGIGFVKQGGHVHGVSNLPTKRQGIPRDTVGKRAVRITLECFLFTKVSQRKIPFLQNASLRQILMCRISFWTILTRLPVWHWRAKRKLRNRK